MLKDIEVKITEILKTSLGDELNLEEVTEYDKFADIGINSLNFVKFTVALEIEFGIDFDIEEMDIKKYSNLQELAGYMVKKLEAS